MDTKFTKEDFMKNYGIVTQEDIKTDYKGLNYISWAKSWRLANEIDPECTYEIVEKEDATGVKHLVWDEQDNSFVVRTKFTFKGKTLPMQLSVMDNSHKAVKKEALTGNYISNSIMRCLAKNIALFGIGLNLYEGEDTPEETEDMSDITKKKKEAKKTPQDKLTDLCKEKIADGFDREKLNNILKKYETNGIVNKMTKENAKKAYDEIKGEK